MTIRIGTNLTGSALSLAEWLRDDIEQRYPALIEHGAVLIGIGDPYLIRASDLGPQIMVPFTRSEFLTSIESAQIAHADAVVIMDAAELARCRAHLARGALIVMPEPLPEGILGPPSAVDALETSDVLARLPSLAGVLGGVATPNVADIRRRVGDALGEALLAVASKDDHE